MEIKGAKEGVVDGESKMLQRDESVRTRGHWSSLVEVHWWCAEVLLPWVKIMAHLG
jgi:hypothetical protein